MVKIYPPTSGMKGVSNVEVYLYDDDHSSSMHRLFMPPLPVHTHLEGRTSSGGNRLNSASPRPSMLAASQLKALLSPGRHKSRGRPQSTAMEYNDEVEDIDTGFDVIENPETLESSQSRRLQSGSSTRRGGVQSVYYRAPETHKKSSFSSRSPRVTMHAKKSMVVVSKDSKSDTDGFSESTTSAVVEKKTKKGSSVNEADLRQVENNLNECVISMAVAHATERVELDNKLADIQSALIYAQKFQQEILLQKVIESDERSLLVESQLKDLEMVVRMSDKVVLREEMDVKMERIGNFLEEIRSIEQAQEEKNKERAKNESELMAERDALRSLVTTCTAEIASLKERLENTETVVQQLSEKNKMPPSGRKTILRTPARGPSVAASSSTSTPVNELKPPDTEKSIDTAASIHIEVPGDDNASEHSTPGRDGSVWVDEASVGDNKSTVDAANSTASSVGVIEERLNTASVIQGKIRDNETLLVRLNAVRSKIKSEISAWIAKFEEKNGRHPSDADKSEILPFYKAYHEASLLYKQTIKELESLKGQHTDLKEQIKGSFAESGSQYHSIDEGK